MEKKTLKLARIKAKNGNYYYVEKKGQGQEQLVLTDGIRKNIQIERPINDMIKKLSKIQNIEQSVIINMALVDYIGKYENLLDNTEIGNQVEKEEQ